MVFRQRAHRPERNWRHLAAAGLAALGIGLGGCDPAATSSDDDSGEVVIGITDAQGDFLNYTLAIEGLELTRADGTVVDVLPLSTELDFSQYTEMTEILTAATVPAGVYVKGTMTLNYDDADIWVEDAGGAAVEVENIVDENGAPVSRLDVSVHLEDRHALVVRPGLPANMTLDFDLKASNMVIFDGGGVPTVTVEPYLVADVALERPKIQRVRGPLQSVDVANSSYEVIIRPFRHPLRDDRRFGVLNVITTDSTVFDIDKQTFTGDDGLAQLDDLDAFAATVAIGDLKFNPRRFEAREVYAGASVPGGDMDVVQGTVLSRTGDVLTVRGATLIRSGGSIAFNDDVDVSLEDSTLVRKQFSADDHGIDDISPGQRVRVFGTITDELDLELDAANGQLRMLLSGGFGTRTDDPAVADDELELNLQHLNGRDVALYDFAGTGDVAGNDADPAAYQVDTAGLNVSDVETGSPVHVRGFATPFGEAPADFDAMTVVDLAGLRAVMGVNWDPSSATAFSDLGDTGLTVDLGGSGERHHLYRRGNVTDLSSLGQAPSITPRDGGRGAFVLEQDRAVRLHTSFDSFADDLQARIDAGGTVAGLRASGHFNDGTATLDAGSVWVRLQ